MSNRSPPTYGPFYPKPTRFILLEATGPEHVSGSLDAAPLGPVEFVISEDPVPSSAAKRANVKNRDLSAQTCHLMLKLELDAIQLEFTQTDKHVTLLVVESIHARLKLLHVHHLVVL